MALNTNVMGATEDPQPPTDEASSINAPESIWLSLGLVEMSDPDSEEEGPNFQREMTRGLLHDTWGAPQAQCARSATIWASGRTRDPYFENIWRGSGTELHECLHVLLHLQQFLIRRQVRYPPYGPWEHVPAHVWTAPTQEDNDDGDVCALCCTKSDPEKMSMCDKCELQYCTDCIDTHTCDNVTFL